MVYVGGMCASAMVMLPCRAASSDDNEAVHWQQAPAFQENYITALFRCWNWEEKLE
jgi:hypothetical protein